MNSPIMSALKLFEAAEANLAKLERLWAKAETLIPSGVAFGESTEYDDTRRALETIADALPKIEGWKLNISLPDLNTIAQNRFDAMEVGELHVTIGVEEQISEPGRLIRDYGFRLRQKRRELVRASLTDAIATIDQTLHQIRNEIGSSPPVNVALPLWDQLRSQVDQLSVLLGNDVPQKARWNDLARHLHFGMMTDFCDIEKMDWPAVKDAVTKGMYAEDEPIPVPVDDLASVVAAKPRGPVSLKLEWQKIDEEQFERLVFQLISSERGYENPEWLMKTNAPDRGRDLSVTRVTIDGLSGTSRARVIIQCRHWLSKSIGAGDVSSVKEQMSLWSDPPVGVLVVATSGRFTADAVQWIDKHNASQQLPKVEMWAESHLERLLAARPALIAEFGLR